VKKNGSRARALAGEGNFARRGGGEGVALGQ